MDEVTQSFLIPNIYFNLIKGDFRRWNRGWHRLLFKRKTCKPEPREVGRGRQKGSDQQREVNTEYQPVNLHLLNSENILRILNNNLSACACWIVKISCENWISTFQPTRLILLLQLLQLLQQKTMVPKPPDFQEKRILGSWISTSLYLVTKSRKRKELPKIC